MYDSDARKSSIFSIRDSVSPDPVSPRGGMRCGCRGVRPPRPASSKIVKIATISGRHGAFPTRCAGNPTQAMWGAETRGARVPDHVTGPSRPRRPPPVARGRCACHAAAIDGGRDATLFDPDPWSGAPRPVGLGGCLPPVAARRARDPLGFHDINASDDRHRSRPCGGRQTRARRVARILYGNLRDVLRTRSHRRPGAPSART